MDGDWIARFSDCPACERTNVKVEQKIGKQIRVRYMLPEDGSIRSAPIGVPDTIATDFNEAAQVLAISPKASAALSRRCLQTVLREAGGVKPGNLSSEIDQVLEDKSVPQAIGESIDAIRNIGNFAAHPIKSSSTGEIVDVEPGEAEWNLDVLDSVFDHYYVQPRILAERREALDRKLADANKPPMK